MGKTSIEWCDNVWNPTRGCSRISTGCEHCYAERIATRFSGPGQPYEGLVTVGRRHPQTGRPTAGVRGKWNGKVTLVPEKLAEPLSWKKSRGRVFVNSMSDLFHESLTNEQIAAVFGVMAEAPQHTFQVLTKRSKRMRAWFEWLADRAEDDGGEWTTLLRETFCWLGDRDAKLMDRIRENGRARDGAVPSREPWPLPNVWLGVSVENQAAADERIPELLKTAAAVRFLSCEPLLGPVDILAPGGWKFMCSNCLGEPTFADEDGCCTQCGAEVTTVGIDWVIAGCESGPGMRRCEVDWLRSLRDQCGGASIPFFLKQAVAVMTLDRRNEPITFGEGSSGEGRVVKLPYLDGAQWKQFPEEAR